MVWTGTWVAERLGVELIGDEALPALLGLALRRNPKRAHLLVSSVLGKHVPQRPSVVYGSGLDLGRRVRALLGDEEAARSVVLGYAETATALGHAVADGLGLAPYLHSTRRPVAGVARAGGFEESHSHATSHLLLPEDPKLLAGDGPLVLVDDEFSTGNTVLNTVRALHERYPRDRYVVVALVDMRSAADLGRLDAFAAEIGARVDLISGAAGTVRLPEGVLEKGQALVAEHERAYAPGAGSVPGSSAAPRRHAPVRVALDWPEGLPDGGRHGFTPDQRHRLETALPTMANRITEALRAPAAEPLRAPADPALPGPTAEGLPGSSAEALPGPTAEGLPGSSAEGLPGPTAEALPGSSAEALPGPTAEGLPGPSDEELSGPTAEEALGATADGRPATPAPPPAGPRVLVLGFEELMYAPLRLGTALEDAGHDVRYSTTTRSPVLAVDDPGYAIRTRLVFPAHDDPADGPGERYAYNVAGAGFDAVVLVVDSTADTPALHAPDGLLAQLAAHIPRVVLAVVPSYTPTASPYVPYDATPEVTEATEAPERSSMLPEPLRGPAFSSYAPEEVGWLLQDLSDVELEAPTEEREEAIQSGGAHYAESLPVEYQPSDRYQELFHAALETSATRIARAVGTVTETVLAERERPGHRPVLVSLARAGTPVGVLMRRWAQARHGLDLPHYAVSIVRGRGIDANALRWLAAHHDPADVVFVDGWTGKGAITRELADAIEEFEAAEGVTGFDPEIAVLADPGSCVRTYGTREDFLIPSACLNSTVSGLISRTVLRADLVGPNDFHGGKFYRELAGADVSHAFLDAVAARFDEVGAAVDTDVKELLAADRTPTWEGWAAVERISEEYGIHDVNLVKPGVGETTRVLLRRVPWKILAKRGAEADLAHVRLLAEQRGVPVEEIDELPYSCVGLIHPQYTRGATGADGKAVVSQ
ncbi:MULTISPECIES: phosphoribosyltransferase domain-containing protein [unclassified Streptomyces]|uniref:phosphoribosyltransferase domain-containing protein n=1 Tax=unclassified Streptomyces TaxID=2593676 RepID=UPI001E3E0CD1|nr:phosphoribosyltransferase domain-containing protein [Streptomyces sp. CB02980]MCB8907471.1 phosphoribosyltransferase domain-containing protein [Streptomyces sp. CB02980]